MTISGEKNRFYRLVITFLAIVLSLVFLGATAFAHPPSNMKLSYNGETQVLTVEVDHRVNNTSRHYVDRMVVSKNGEQVLVEEYQQQNARSGGKFEYEVPARNGDSITVKAECNRFGQISRTIEVQGVQAGRKVLLLGRLGTSNAVPEVAEGTPNMASGLAIAILDTENDILHYSIAYKGLSGTPTMAHFHRGASGETGPPVRTIFGKPEIAAAPDSPPEGISGFITGKWTTEGQQPLTEELEDAILAGKIYVNIHTEFNKGGEIRAQLQKYD